MWSGRTDGVRKERFHQKVVETNLKDFISDPKRKNIIFLGFECDEGIIRNQGRAGAKEGPLALRKALASLPLLRDDVYLCDIGNIVATDGNLELAQQQLAEAIAAAISKQAFPIVLGGGHELSWGHFLGLKSLPGKQGLINLDAHLDMRSYTAGGNSGTSFLQMADESQKRKNAFDYLCIGAQRSGNTPSLFESAKKWGVNIVFAEDIHLKGNQSALEPIEQMLMRVDHLYLSICLDVFASAYAPGVSAPQPLGLTPWQVIFLLRKLAASGKVRSLDIAELSPPFDHEEMTARLAASLLFDWIHHF